MFVTNLDWDEKDICRFCDKRADVENHIKEDRYDFSIDHISTQSFYANAADLGLRLLAMNQIIMFAREALSLTFEVEMTIVVMGNYEFVALFHRKEVAMPVPLKKRGTGYTYQDYLTWPDEERWEIIEGLAYDMSPAPSVKHQELVSNFHIALKTHPDNNCFTGIAPTDVVLDEHNVVQPDVFVVCDRTKIGEQAITGALDLVIEVVSPATEVKDRREKKRAYEKFGVAEYILVFPEREYVERYLLEEGKYGAPEIVNWDETIKIVTLDMELNLWEIFDKERPSQEEEIEEG